VQSWRRFLQIVQKPKLEGESVGWSLTKVSDKFTNRNRATSSVNFETNSFAPIFQQLA